MSDAVIAPIWVVVNILLAWSSLHLCSRLFPGEHLSQKFVNTSVVCWASIVGLAMLLGNANALTGSNLAAALTGLALVFTIASWRLGRATKLHSDKFGARSAPGANDQPGPWARRLEWVWAGFWCVALAYLLGRVVVDGILEFPNDWDTLMYHLPLIDNFSIYQSIYNDESGVWYNAANNELIGCWLAAPFSGDFLIGFNNLPACLLLPALTFELGRLLGLRKSLCHLTALAATGTRVVSAQILSAGNDVPVAVFFMAALYYGIRYLQRGRLADLVLASMSFSLVAGVKYYGIGYALVAWAVVFLLALLIRNVRSGVLVAVVGVIGMILLSGSWYVRNALITGKPFYPLSFQSNDRQALEHPDHTRGTLFAKVRADNFPLLEDAIWQRAGCCHYFAFLLFPLSATWLLISALRLVRREGRAGVRIDRLALCMAAVGAGLVLGVIPFTAETNPGTLNMLLEGYSPIRFGLSFFNLALLALVVVIEDVLSRGRIQFFEGSALTSSPAAAAHRRRRFLGQALAGLPIAIYAVCAVIQFFASQPALIPTNQPFILRTSFGTLIVLVAIALFWRLKPRLRKPLVFMIGLTCVGTSALAADYLSAEWHRDFIFYYDHLFMTNVFKVMQENPRLRLDPKTAKICVLTYQPYPFFGSRRQFRVTNPRYSPTFPEFIDYLRRHGVTTVVVLNTDNYFFNHGGFTDCAEWIRVHPELFTGKGSDKTFSAFDVNLKQLANFKPPVP